MRILVLHGFGQSGEVVRRKCKKLLRGLGAEVLCPDGPLSIAHPPRVGEETPEPGHAWFYLNPETPNHSGEYLQRASTEWFEVDRALELLRALAPVDVIVGFSQGAMMARYAARELGCTKICYISGAARPLATNLAPLSDAHVDTLHCYGESDQVVSREESLELAALYPNATVFVHSSGHVIPSSSAFRHAFRRFLTG